MVVTVMAVGDIFPNGRFFREGTPISPEFSQTLDVFKSSDIRHATFLMPLSERASLLTRWRSSEPIRR